MTAPAQGEVVPLWINGQRTAATSNKTFPVINPLTKAVVHHAAAASSADCEKAIQAAQAAFQSWDETPPSVKHDLFLRAAKLSEDPEFQNKVIAANVAETASTAMWVFLNNMTLSGMFRDAAEIALKVAEEQVTPAFTPGGSRKMRRRAYGVILAMAPWNAPTSLAIRAVSTPLACGNTVVFKTSELSPNSQFLLGEFFKEAGFPPGVFNVISMDPEDVPRLTAEIIANPLVRKINFTGGDKVGRLIAIEAAKHLKPCVLELGGKAGTIVLKDADIEAAAQGIVFGGMLHSGQVCMSTERVVVERPVAEALKAAMKRIASNLRAANQAEDPKAQLSSMISDEAAENLVKILQEAKAKGAEFLVGDGTRTGAILQPHLVTGVTPGMKLWDRETFAPVVVVVEAENEDEAVKLVNTSEYSLTGAVWTADIEKGNRIAERIRTGHVYINGATVHGERIFSGGGLGGASGYGRFEMEDWTERRMIVHYPDIPAYTLG